jgi:hypothetical protein
VKCAIEKLPFVTVLSPVRAVKGKGRGYGVTLRCPSCEEYGSCGKKQEPPVYVSDNATHLKSKENLLFWSERPSKYKEFIKMVLVEYGCPGHGKVTWDGLGVMAKTNVTRDLTDGNVQTPSGRITSPLEVVQHLRAQFCNRQWKKERMNMKIN